MRRERREKRKRKVGEGGTLNEGEKFPGIGANDVLHVEAWDTLS